MDDNRLYILLTRSNDFLEDSSAFEEAVRDTFSGDEQVLADYIVKLHKRMTDISFRKFHQALF